MRKRKKLVQNQIPELLKISRVTWSNYENDHTQPDIDKLIDIADFFQVSIDHLLKTDLSENEHLLNKPYPIHEPEKDIFNEPEVLYQKEVDLLILKQLNTISDNVTEIKEKLNSD